MSKDSNGFVFFRNAVIKRLGSFREQYPCYVGGQEGYPDLGDGLRFQGDSESPAELKIHKGDVAEFVRRVTAYEADFVDFGSVSHFQLRQQTQYASRYIDGEIDGYPNLGEGLRFIRCRANYHAIKIHKDDVDEFVSRVLAYRDR